MTLGNRLPASGAGFRIFRVTLRQKFEIVPTSVITGAGSLEPEALLLPSVVFRDVHDFVLVDEQIRRTLARHSNHVPVVVLDPTADQLAIH